MTKKGLKNDCHLHFYSLPEYEIPSDLRYELSNQEQTGDLIESEDGELTVANYYTRMKKMIYLEDFAQFRDVYDMKIEKVQLVPDPADENSYRFGKNVRAVIGRYYLRRKNSISSFRFPKARLKL